MSKPSVLHVYKDFYPSVVGGVEKCINWMCRETRSDYNVRVLVASRDGAFGDGEVEGVRVVRAPCWGRVLSAPVAPAFVGWLRRLDSDIIHFHMPNPTGELASLLAPTRRGRVAVTYHSDIVRQRMTGFLYRPLQQCFLRRAAVIMPTSQRYLETSPTLQPHLDRCKVVPLGVPLQDLDETDTSRVYSSRIRERAAGRTVIVFIGVMRYYKGLPFLIEAMRGLPASCCLFLAGSVPDGKKRERHRLEEVAKTMGVADRVFFLGEVSDDEAVGLRRAGDVFCMPSHLRGEAFGLTQVEAMVCGLPVVSTDLPGVSEVNHDGETGCIVPPGDTAALAKALAGLIENPDLRRSMGQAARRRAETLYSSRAMGEKLDEIYKTLLEGNA